MQGKKLSAVLGIVLMGGLVAGVGISNAATTAAPKTTKPSTTVTTTTTTQSKVKVSQDQARQIALKAHKDGKFLDAQLANRVYLIHLQTPKGKVTMQIGANTGRILSDSLAGASPKGNTAATPKATGNSANNTKPETKTTTTTDNTTKK